MEKRICIITGASGAIGTAVCKRFLKDGYRIAMIGRRMEALDKAAKESGYDEETKDYIKNPKSNGYRSLHLIVEIPVFFSDRKKDMRVEVQIRTIAMDFWASLEHQLKYKQSISNEDVIVAELKECAEDIAATDRRMMEIRDKINAGSLDISPMDDFIDKINRFQVATL